MQISYRNVEKGKQRGAKSLIQCLKVLEISNHEDKQSACEEIKAVVIQLRIQISHRLIEYFLLMAVLAKNDDMAQKLDDFRVIIEFLKVHQDSIILKSFLNVMNSVEEALKSNGFEIPSVENELYDEAEVEILHLIHQEVLSFEAAL